MNEPVLFAHGPVRVTATTVAAGEVAFNVASVSGVRVVPASGNKGVLLLGLLVLSAALPYAGCAYMCVASGASNAGDDPILVIFGAVAFGLALVVLGFKAEPRRDVFVIVNGAEQLFASVPAKEEAAAAAMQQAILSAASQARRSG